MKSRFEKGQEIYQISVQSKKIYKHTVKSCGLQKLTLVSDSYHGNIRPTEKDGDYLVYHSTEAEALKELDKHNLN
jgi:hypothetical protein